MPAAAFVDGYPASPSDSDYAIQCIIDAELVVCHNRRTGLTKEQLYPAYFAATETERASWLEPALRRAEWSAGREPWFGYIHGLIEKLLPSHLAGSRIPEQTLALLARLGPRLQRNGGGTDCHHLNAHVSAFVRSTKRPLPEETRDALHAFVRHLIQVHCHGPATFDIAWYLWRTGQSVEPCFSETIRREATTEYWVQFWNLRGGDPASIRQAIEDIGIPEFAQYWNSWMQRASQQQPVIMSAGGREVLIYLLRAFRTTPNAPVDEGLYTLCGLRWAGEGNNRLTKEWLGELLQTLAMRPQNNRLACVECLTQNPDTRRFPEVAVTYDHLMAAMTDDVLPPEDYTCIDGFPIESEPQFAAQHRRIDRFLRAVIQYRVAYQTGYYTTEFAWSAEPVQTRILAADASASPMEFLHAISTRRQPTRSSPLDADQFLACSCALGELARQLLETSPSPTAEGITALIHSEARLPSTAADALFQIVEAHIEQHGYTAPMVEAMRAWHKATHGSHAAMALRHQMGWLLWFEDVTPIKLADCWSNHVRASLRTKPKPVQAAWRKLLENVSFGTGEKPPKKWLKPAAKALATVGAEEFRTSIRGWFEPFRAEQPLRLTVVGRDILRNLLFYALLAEDPAVDEAIAWFAAARWKTKKDQTCVTIVLSAFTHVLIERNPELAYDTFTRHALPLTGKNLDRIRALSTKLGRPMPSTAAVTPRPMPDPLAAMRKAMTAMLTGPNARLEGDDLIITGTHDTYTLRIADGGMYRHSDNRPVHIALDMTDQEFAPFQHMIDAMDLQHPFQPNYVRLSLCAKVLENDAANVDIIRTDN